MKIIIYTVITFLISNSYAGIFNKRLGNYWCKNEQDAMSCNQNCKRLKILSKIDYESEFKVNVVNGIVMWSGFNLNENIGNGILENCKVIDEQNWICESSLEILNIKQIKIMKNGIYSEIEKGSPSSFSCAK